MKTSSCCEPKNKGIRGGIISGLIPHAGCIAFIALSIFGATAAASIFRPLLLNSYFFYGLIALSFVFATISAALYLKKNGSLSLNGINDHKGYLSIMYGTTIAINLLLFLVIFPYAANAANDSSQIGQNKLTLSVNIPCSGHAPLIINDLKKEQGIKSVKFILPNKFEVSYTQETSIEQILNSEIFTYFPAKVA